MDDLYMANLDEFIIAQRKLVSYKWLSLTLNVSANIAKQMLYHFYEQHKLSPAKYDLDLTYFVSGTCINKETNQELHKVCIVRDTDLASVKSSMSKIFSVHIYSIQRSKLKDLNLLYAKNYDKVKEDIFKISQFSHIKCSSAQKRTPAEIEAALAARKVVVQPSTSVQETPKQNQALSSSTGASIKPKNNAKPNAIASMFSNQAKKASSAMESKPVKTSVSSNKKGNKMMSAFLSKSPTAKPVAQDTSKTKPAKDEAKIKIKEEVDNKPSTDAEEEMDVIDDESPLSVKKEPLRSAAGRKNKKPPSKLSSKRMSSSSKASTASKRRRVMTLDSDSSSNESDPEEEYTHDECPMPPPPVASLNSDDEDIIPNTPQDQPIVDVMKVGKSKTKKLVDTTFTDVEGYLVTKKEYQMVSDDSDSENPLPPPKKESPSSKENRYPKNKSSPKKFSPKKKSPRKSSPKKGATTLKRKKSSPTKSKQASIRNFFTKK